MDVATRAAEQENIYQAIKDRLTGRADNVLAPSVGNRCLEAVVGRGRLPVRKDAQQRFLADGAAGSCVFFVGVGEMVELSFDGSGNLRFGDKGVLVWRRRFAICLKRGNRLGPVLCLYDQERLTGNGGIGVRYGPLVLLAMRSSTSSGTRLMYTLLQRAQRSDECGWSEGRQYRPTILVGTNTLIQVQHVAGTKTDLTHCCPSSVVRPVCSESDPRGPDANTGSMVDEARSSEQ